MKSIRAKEYIEEWIFDAADLVDADGVGNAVVKRNNALKAVEIAEEETEELMQAKAISAFQESTNGYFIIGGVDYTASIMEKFIQKLNINERNSF